MNSDYEMWMNKVNEVLNDGSDFTISSVDEFNKGIDHIFGLIKDSFLLYKNESYPSVYYLAVIIIEEVAKLHMGLFTSHSNPTNHRKKGKLYDHKTKDIIGCNPSIPLGYRLNAAIGELAIKKIYEEAYSGIMKEKREQAFYFSKKNGQLIIPNELYSKEDAKNILLFAIEAFDDHLVGYTNYSMEISKETDRIFDKLCSGEQV